MSRLTLPLATLGVALTMMGCNADISSALDPDGDNYEVLCDPTGMSLYHTGVYIGPDGCEEATLYIVDEEDPSYWLLSVSWPMYGEYFPLSITNLTTGDTEREYIYGRDPEFLLYGGDYLLGGLEVVEGINELEYTLWDGTGEEDVLVYEEGTFTLDVVFSD